MIRELWQQDELRRLRQERDQEVQRSLYQEERAEQGVLRERMMEEVTATLIGLLIESRGVIGMDDEILPGTEILVCRGCHAETTGTNHDDLEHLKTCAVKRAQDRIIEHTQRRMTTEPLREPGELVRLRQALVATHGLSVLAQCPSCLAERTNGERHDDNCALMETARNRPKELTRCAACEAIYGAPSPHKGIPH